MKKEFYKPSTHKYIFILFFLLAGIFYSGFASAQSTVINYVVTWSASAPETDINTLISRPLKDVKQVTQYIDGLGRPLQTVAEKGSLATGSSPLDLITQVNYDAFGRQDAQYLPYPSGSNGNYKTTASVAQPDYYESGSSPVTGQGETGTNAVIKTVYELSPLNRILKTLPPGNSWAGSNRGTQQGYWVNTAIDAVRLWTVTNVTPGSGFGTYNSATTYPAGRLYKNITTDEAGKQVIEFKDKDEHTVLKKVQLTATADAGTGSAHTGWLCTYYIYDDLGNLRCVIQPKGVEIMNTPGSWSLTASLLAEQCFRYEYDQRNHMIMKKIPGTTAETRMIYDARDRLVMTQDANFRAANNWMVTQYDDFDRPEYTWIYTTGTAFTSLLAAAAASTAYPSAAIPASPEVQTHYDDYAGLPAGLTATYKNTWNSYFDPTSTTTFPYPEKPVQNTTISTKGLVTWTQAKMLVTSPVNYLASVNIYDNKGRLIQTQAQNISGGRNDYAVGGINVTTTEYTWFNQPYIVVVSEQKTGGLPVPATITTVTRYTYDNLNRVVKTEERVSNTLVNGGAMTSYVTISQVQYDDLGQMKVKKLGNQKTSATAYSTNPLETQTFDYNIRGWLLGINRAYVRDVSSTSTNFTEPTEPTGGEMFTESNLDALAATVTYPATNYFGFDLGYDKTNNNLINGKTYVAAQYTGNITGTIWKCANDKKVRKYDFTYDAANRFMRANFAQYTASDFSSVNVNYTVNNIAYDANGNLVTMRQFGLTTATTSAAVDDLTYSYLPGSNKLLNVADAVNNPNTTFGDFHYPAATKTATTIDYTYDANGNMITDANKKLSITYNYLNLPSVITVTGKGSVTYLYDALGNKLEKIVKDNTVSPSKTTVTMYIGNSIFHLDSLQFINTSEGRIRVNSAGNGFVFDYFLKDQLGSTRMVITDDYTVASPILEATSYYPFGLTMQGISSSALNFGSPGNKYKFNGIEQNNDFDLNIYDAFYRNLDPQVGRFWQVDPKPAEYESPYVAMGNNPILMTDFLGDTTIYYNMANGSVLGTITNEGAAQRIKVNAGAYLVANVISLVSGQDLSKQGDANTFVNNLNGTLSKADENLGTNLIAFGTGELTMTFTGAADENNSAQANGTLNVNAMFDDGSDVTIASYQAVGGPYGNGAPENGAYTADNLQDRSRTGWYNPGMTRDGVGFSMNLNPQFPTGRSLERIHPDGNVPGTQGCIGLQVDANRLQEFRSTMRDYLRTHGNINVNVNIQGNPNNNGRGSRVINNGE